jgi:hypothetical protein
MEKKTMSREDKFSVRHGESDASLFFVVAQVDETSSGIN